MCYLNYFPRLQQRINMTSPGFSTTERPVIIGHRGASGHATANSLEAFRIAASPARPSHCDGVEFDLQTTSDGAFVVHHDPVLATGELIAAMPLSRVCATRLPDGSPVPTLGAVLQVLAGLEVFVEAKTLPPEADSPLLALLRAYGPDRSSIHAFDHRIIARLHRADPDVRLGVLSGSYPIDPVRQVRDAGATMLWQEASLIDAPLVAACRQEGIALIAWTVNNAVEGARLAELGVDGLCGNWPERLRTPRRWA
jgi:glycerophosphoryl diester phosphodiesterase